MSVDFLQEVIMKSITALLLLMLKHFKLNHVYQVHLLDEYELCLVWSPFVLVQFEFMSQHLVFANCIPLVLKLFNQNVPIFVAAKNKFLPQSII